ncbi:hypothetical protein [Periweissella fabalis]|uniref:Uncharacterized protein n=1 Tax=Periweissella fabalis TaxID=1070421 RepID=A0A7X6N2W3_9LACO|nr:hypothetical protein [Periweissella fabalis]MCM0598214.1 hypothetical protein [Periweissella fabalis]NKZ24851.1 hypothetical protein [Periweissella fabalis]
MKTPPYVCLYPNSGKNVNNRKPASVKIDFRVTNALIIELDKRHKIKQVDLAGGNICQPAVSRVLSGDSSALSFKTLLVFGKQYDMVGGLTHSVNPDVFAEVSKAYLNNNKRQFAEKLEQIKYKDLIDIIDKLLYHVYDMVLLNTKGKYQQVIEGQYQLGQFIAQSRYIRIELMYYNQLAIAYLNLNQITDLDRIFAHILALLKQYKERQEVDDELHYMHAMLGYETLQRHMRQHNQDKKLDILSQKMRIWYTSQSHHAGVIAGVSSLVSNLKNK